MLTQCWGQGLPVFSIALPTLPALHLCLSLQGQVLQLWYLLIPHWYFPPLFLWQQLGSHSFPYLVIMEGSYPWEIFSFVCVYVTEREGGGRGGSWQACGVKLLALGVSPHFLPWLRQWLRQGLMLFMPVPVSLTGCELPRVLNPLLSHCSSAGIIDGCSTWPSFYMGCGIQTQFFMLSKHGLSLLTPQPQYFHSRRAIKLISQINTRSLVQHTLLLIP